MDSTLDTETGPAAIAAASNALTADWAERIADGESTVFSGAGVWPLLGLLALGADEPARTELAGAFGMDPALAGTAARRFVDLFDQAPALHGALGLWYRDSLTIRESWLDELPPATRGRLTGDLAADKEHLDAWAREHTNGLIKRMPITLTSATLLVLASAILVETQWRQPFTENPRQVVEGPWAGDRRLAALSRTVEPSAIRIVDAGNGTGPVTVTLVEGSDDIDVSLFLGGPDIPANQVVHAGVTALGQDLPGTAVDQVPEDLTGPGISSRMIQSTSDRPTAMLHTARFTVRAEHDLMTQAEMFGLETVADSPTGHLSGISPDHLCIGSANQDAMAQFSAAGFKAAAVTAFGMRSAAMVSRQYEVREYTATYDRPFGFAAVHRPSGLILVAGWVADPEVV